MYLLIFPFPYHTTHSQFYLLNLYQVNNLHCHYLISSTNHSFLKKISYVTFKLQSILLTGTHINYLKYTSDHNACLCLKFVCWLPNHLQTIIEYNLQIYQSGHRYPTVPSAKLFSRIHINKFLTLLYLCMLLFPLLKMTFSTSTPIIHLGSI